jgi:hypothetical protein
MRKRIFAVITLLVLALTVVAQDAKRGPSTPEERKRFVAITHKMEQAPLDDSLRPETRWALVWLIEVPDVTASLCTAPLGDFMKKKYKYSPEIVTQLTFSSGAFVIEHLDKADDKGAQYVAGVEGALKAYSAILSVKPDAHSKALDELLQKQSQGQLADYVVRPPAKAVSKKDLTMGEELKDLPRVELVEFLRTDQTGALPCQCLAMDKPAPVIKSCLRH